MGVKEKTFKSKMNIVCSLNRSYSTNFYHFLAQQMQAIYYYTIENSLDKVNLYYKGPFNGIVNELPFVRLFDLAEAPANSEIIEPIKDYKQIKAYGHYLKFNLLPRIKVKQENKITVVARKTNRVFNNLDELVDALNSLADVEVVYLEDLTFLEQFEKLYNSKVIIKPHGASMAFCMLLSSFNNIIELYPKYFNTLSYYSDLANKFSIPHIEIENKSSLFDCKEEDREFLTSMKNSASRYDKKDIQDSHRLRSLLRDVDFITIDIDKVKGYCKNILKK